MMNRTTFWISLVVSASVFTRGVKADSTALKTLTGHKKSVWSVSFSPDGTKILSASWDNTIKLWDVKTGKARRTQTFSTSGSWAIFSPNGKNIVTVTSSVQLWDARTGALKRVLNNTPEEPPIAFSPQGETLAIAIRKQETLLLDTRTNKIKVKLNDPDKADEVMSVVFSPNGKLVATGDSKLVYKEMFNPVGMQEGGTIKLWDAHSGKLLHIFKGHTSYVQSVAFSPDGKTLASGSTDTTVKLWDVRSRSLIRTLKSNQRFNGVFSVAFSPNGKILASGGFSLRLWNPATGKLVDTLKGHRNAVHSVSFSPNGKMLVSGSWDGTLKLWSMPSLNKMR